MQTVPNPFQAKNPFSRDSTHLLNYGENNITLYHTLTRKPFASKSRSSLLSETKILRKVRREVFEAQKQIKNQDKCEPLFEESYAREGISDHYWNNLPKTQSYKTFRNPYTGTYSSAMIAGTSTSPNISVKDNNRILMELDLDKKRQMIRKEVKALKSCLSQSKEYLRITNQSSSSVSKLYQQKLKNYDYTEGGLVFERPSQLVNKKTLESRFSKPPQDQKFKLK